jgi:hypothetical protein
MVVACSYLSRSMPQLLYGTPGRLQAAAYPAAGTGAVEPFPRKLVFKEGLALLRGKYSGYDEGKIIRRHRFRERQEGQ